MNLGGYDGAFHALRYASKARQLCMLLYDQQRLAACVTRRHTAAATRLVVTGKVVFRGLGSGHEPCTVRKRR